MTDKDKDIIEQGLEYACRELAAQGICAMNGKFERLSLCPQEDTPKAERDCAMCWQTLLAVMVGIAGARNDK